MPDPARIRGRPALPTRVRTPLGDRGAPRRPGIPGQNRRNPFRSISDGLSRLAIRITSGGSRDEPEQPPQIPGQVAAPSARVRRIRRARVEFDAAEEVLVMEFMAKGSLGAWLSKFNQLEADNKPWGTRPPNVILWTVFHCLLRGCIAMAYPLDKRSTPDPSTEQISRRTEVYPEGSRRAVIPKDPMVHFNLKPSNGKTAWALHMCLAGLWKADMVLSVVLLGSYDERGGNSHEAFPIAKASRLIPCISDGDGGCEH